MNNIERLNQNLINSTDFQEIQKDYLLSLLLDTDNIVLIRDIFVYKGNKMIFKGNQKQIGKEEFSLFLRDTVNPNLCKNYIVVVNDKDVCIINEDGTILKYNNLK
ncbi:hypothetical protein [Flavobacterium branchiicola]|uniref:Uncharacterized protein n=1 Tax=Flavobacterium branchiicola TaxID=1114875 RepID=A0ABV9PK84_9FLAO|nr:hypothetical protein [Flavobacterium branchiicola]MBS7256328.1 hypothetical protein [Flavobacterium branchiicola]